MEEPWPDRRQERTQEQAPEGRKDKTAAGSGPPRKKRGSRKRIWPVIAGVCALLSAVYGGVIYFFSLDLTQAGGLGFLMAALVWLTARLIKERKEGHRNIWMS